MELTVHPLWSQESFRHLPCPSLMMICVTRCVLLFPGLLLPSDVPLLDVTDADEIFRLIVVPSGSGERLPFSGIGVPRKFDTEDEADGVLAKLGGV